MKLVKLDAGEVTVRPLTWKEKKICQQLSDFGNGVIKETVYLEQVEYRITDKPKEWIDNLSIEDGEKLRRAVIEVISPKPGDEKN